jgi:hypothetical protein
MTVSECAEWRGETEEREGATNALQGWCGVPSRAEHVGGVVYPFDTRRVNGGARRRSTGGRRAGGHQ